MVSAGVAAAGALQWLCATKKSAPKDRYEAAALFVHAVLLQHGFRPEGAPAREFGADYVPEEKIPDDWNHNGYGGKYRHHQSGLTFELRMVPLGSRLMATATIVEQDDKTFVADLRLDSYVRDDAKFGDENEANWDETFKNIQDMASVIQLNLAYKLVPDSAKTVDQEKPSQSTTAATATTEQQTRRQEPAPGFDPLRIGPPRRPVPQMVDPMNPYPGMPGMVGIGDDDLVPAGLRGIGGQGFGPAAPGWTPGGGSLVGPEHPMFGQGAGLRDPGIGGPRLPRGAVPPGAHFDPFGPPGVGGGAFDPARFGPDPDHDRPPPPDMYW